ncbi:hypothetical protein BU24DRAFT_420939 [Aaosphaeria arxii CBS 175.79]|uniref:PPP4R2-domain-containing protein n=1 Tax=Aaosphaeria arxii CBS 175.79 TaxID=1450172 RepID=A0A6A5XZ21_9PLEO|nr:uncharacterized protein BU24DRAFT_420939 [Aaosphaeria arxii CBS 175.79]KAF2017880.1 hypothetical protein BU24DRAFT_420939 [Aaosphaeria arxii CBS 175.79]
MASTESILQTAADNGTLEVEDWPKAFQYILDRLDEIIHNEFPPPPSPPSDPLTPSATAQNQPPPPQIQPAFSSQTSETADKENAPPATPPRPPVPAFTSTPSNANNTTSSSLPSECVNFYSSIRTQLTSNFTKSPPHTIQRLAELVIQPKRHYRYLPAYLRALDRVVSVSSPTTTFPLPQALLPSASSTLLNGATSPSTSSALGSDESLGGALLTPIPWLQSRGSQTELISESTEMVEGPNGAGRIETVTVMGGMLPNQQAQAHQIAQQQQQQIASSHPDGETLPYTGPVTQGELLRQEQEAGIVLSNPHHVAPIRPIATDAELEDEDRVGIVIGTVEDDAEDEAPHARGPEVIGMEDTGPQRAGAVHLDIEGAVGRPSIERSSRSPQPQPQPQSTNPATDDKEAEAEEDTNDEEMDDVDGEAKEEEASADKAASKSPEKTAVDEE